MAGMAAQYEEREFLGCLPEPCKAAIADVKSTLALDDREKLLQAVTVLQRQARDFADYALMHVVEPALLPGSKSEVLKATHGLVIACHGFRSHLENMGIALENLGETPYYPVEVKDVLREGEKLHKRLVKLAVQFFEEVAAKYELDASPKTAPTPPQDEIKEQLATTTVPAVATQGELF